MNLDFNAVCARLGVATLNGLYQGVLVFLLVAGLLRVSVKINAATRHAVWFAALCLVALLIPAHFWLDPLPLSSAAEESPRLRGAGPFSRVEFWPTGPEIALVEPEENSYFQIPGLEEASPESIALGGARLVPAGSAKGAGQFWTRAATALARRTVSAMERARDLAGRVLHPVEWRIESTSAFPVLAGSLLFWLCAGAFKLAILAARLRQVRGFSRESLPAEAKLQRRFEELCREGKVNRRAELRISKDGHGPLVLGFFRPVVLLPAEMAAQASNAELDHVLRHELAHVRRYDDWANLAQHFIQALLFFQPSVWWIGRRLSLEREIACDDHVLDQVGGRRGYALVLTNVAGRLSQRTPLLAPGVSNSLTQLQQRINMILDTRRNASPRLAKGWSVSLVSATAVLAVLAFYSGPRLVAAASASSAAAPAQPVLAAADAAPGAGANSFAAVSPGPKSKPDAPEGEPQGEPSADEMVPPSPPAEPEWPAVNKAPVTPRIARSGKAPEAPPTPDAPALAANEDGSLEARVRRLEKMIRQLVGPDGAKRSHAFVYNDLGELKFTFDREQADKLKQSNERQAARAAEQAQRAAEMARRSTKDMEARLEKERAGLGELHQSLHQQLESLRQAREGLSKEMDRLSRQIEKLEREQEHQERDQGKDPDRRGESTDGKARAQSAANPKITR